MLRESTFESPPHSDANTENQKYKNYSHYATPALNQINEEL